MRQIKQFLLPILLMVGMAAADAPRPTFNALDDNTLQCAEKVYSDRVAAHTRNQRVFTGALVTASAAGVLYLFYPEMVSAGITSVGGAALKPIKGCATALTPQFIANYLKRPVPAAPAKQVIKNITTATFNEELEKHQGGWLWRTGILQSMLGTIALGYVQQLFDVYKKYDIAWALDDMSISDIGRRVKQHAAAVDPDDAILSNNGSVQIQLYGDDAIAQINNQPSELDVVNDLLTMTTYVQAQRKADNCIETEREFADLALAWNHFVVRVAFILAAAEREHARLGDDCSLEKNDLVRYREAVISTMNLCSANLNNRSSSKSYDGLLSTVYVAVTKVISSLHEARLVGLH